jgi:hypothetical protein
MEDNQHFSSFSNSMLLTFLKNVNSLNFHSSIRQNRTRPRIHKILAGSNLLQKLK